jgi:DNA-binding MarR family transcriptional regulator/GNAT superfamily N-acetyltransferase
MYLSSLGSLALGSRFKALSEALYDAVDEVYRARGIELQARWFPVLRLLHDTGGRSVSEIAREIGQTHSAVSQLAVRLVQAGWLRSGRDRADHRKNVLTLTPKTQAELRKAKSAWRAIGDEVSADIAHSEHDLLQAMAALEARLASLPLADRVVKRLQDYDRASIRYVPFSHALRDHFYRLNAEWLLREFYIEEIDHQVLSQPERALLQGGGYILFAQLGDEVVGTCALRRERPGVYELTKMAVTQQRQGLGIGRGLLQGAIDEFQRRKGKQLFLESSSKLTTALNLYESAGFVRQTGPRPGSHYQRADVYMIWKSPDRVAPARALRPSRIKKRARVRRARDLPKGRGLKV